MTIPDNELRAEILGIPVDKFEDGSPMYLEDVFPNIVESDFADELLALFQSKLQQVERQAAATAQVDAFTHLKRVARQQEMNYGLNETSSAIIHQINGYLDKAEQAEEALQSNDGKPV